VRCGCYRIGRVAPKTRRRDLLKGPPVYCGNISHLFSCASAYFQSMPGLE